MCDTSVLSRPYNGTNSQTARKSTGGRDARRQYTPDEVRSTVIKDHSGDNVQLVWFPRSSNHDPDTAYPFPFQVYLADNATQTINDPGFAAEFSLFIDKLGGISDGDCQYRFEIYTKSHANILSCVEHQRAEVNWRNRNGIWPHLVQSWATADDSGHKGFIIVIDSDHWATEGFTLVAFDPAAYTEPAKFYAWNRAVEGDIDVVHATRHRDIGKITAQLTRWWWNAGFEWTQSDLARRNEGGFSPALYPAVDPEAHDDVEHDDAASDTLPAPAIDGDDAEDEDGYPRIIDTFSKDELWVLPGPLDGRFKSKTYGDSTSQHTVSVWDSKKSALRPKFSVALYCGTDAIYAAEALFGCLNKGLIADEAWTLDVKRGFQTLHAAYEHHNRETARRTAAKVSQRMVCMKMLTRKVARDRLPNELLEYIEEALVPPEIPNYAALPNRPFQGLFLYFDPGPSKSVSEGPLLIYSHPLPSSTSLSWRESYMYRHSFSYEPLVSQDDVLRVRNLRYWHRVADELHIIWSLCCPRSDAVCLDGLPRISLDIDIQEHIVARPNRHDTPGYTVTLQSDFEQPIRIHMRFPFSHELWYEALDLVDLTTGSTCPSLPYERATYETLSCWDSWALTPDLGFRPTLIEAVEGELEPYFMLMTLEPGKRMPIELPWRDWWSDRRGQCVLIDGHEYALRLKDGLTVPRWTFGRAADALKGPYNLPAIPVTMEKEVRFKYNWKELEEPLSD